MEDILKNELFIEHLSKLLSNLETVPENSEKSQDKNKDPEEKSLVNPMNQLLPTESNDPLEESTVLKEKVCENFESLSYQIKNAFEVSENVTSDKENSELRQVPQKKGEMFTSNTSNLRRTANSEVVTARKKQFLTAVIQKFNLNLKKRRQNINKKSKGKKSPKINVLEKTLLNKVGLGLSEMEYYYIENDLRILSTQRKNNFKFLGKIFGRKSDYYIIVGGNGVGVNGGTISELSQKQKKQEMEPEGFGLNRFEVWVARHNRMVGGNTTLRNNLKHLSKQTNFLLNFSFTGKSFLIFLQK